MVYDPIIEMQEIRNQLSYSKRIGFLLGAGTSKTIGISDINQLTTNVIEKLPSELQEDIKKVKACLGKPECNIEDLLNHVRLVREITSEDKKKSFEGVNGESAKALDIEICNKIYDVIIQNESTADLSIPKKFVSWLNWLNRDFSKEIFTLNYDLILEKSFESMQIPFFDGFIGSIEPFFLPESLEMDLRQNYLPTTWIRLWKMHGSLGWFWRKDEQNKSRKIVRLGVHAKGHDDNNEIVIYPSKDKYLDSRKQPFLSYFDRLRSYLLDGEGLFIISGYSFGDPHVNSIIFECLKQNNRLHVLGFFHSDKAIDYLEASDHLHMNISAFGSGKAIIKGVSSKWEKSTKEESLEVFWNSADNKFILGDFKNLVDFLLFCSGAKDKIEGDLVTS